MATVTGYTADRMLQIENETVVSGEVDENGDLILTTREGTEINAGPVMGSDGEPGIDGPPGGYQIGTISAWASHVAPTWGWILDGETIVDGALTHSAIAAIYPDWVVGNDIVKPDWRGRVPVGYKAGDDTFFTLGALVGSKLHDHLIPSHTHGLDGVAAIMMTTGMVAMRRVAAPSSYSVNYRVTNVSWAGYSDSQGVGAELIGTATSGGSGSTGNKSSVQPSVVVNWVVCVATSSGEFDTEVQTALVASVNEALVKVNAVPSIQHGYESDLGTGTDIMTVSVVFPEPFAVGTIPTVTCTMHGYRAGTTPPEPTETGSGGNKVQSSPQLTAISNTGFTVELSRSSGAYSTSGHYMVAWSAFGQV